MSPHHAQKPCMVSPCCSADQVVEGERTLGPAIGYVQTVLFPMAASQVWWLHRVE